MPFNPTIRRDDELNYVRDVESEDRTAAKTEEERTNPVVPERPTKPTPEPEVPDYSGGGGGGGNTGSNISYDDYLNAMAELEERRKGEGYVGQNQDLIDGLVQSILNRGSFSYDLDDDAMYQQYRDRYIDQANMGMRDTMGQAAALTGGYGSSYGQAVGQQAYDRTMQGLNDIVPQLEQNAYNRWADEGSRQRQDLALLMEQDNQDYNRWVTERAYTDEQNDKAKSELMSWIQIGYKPTAEDLARAGITPEQYEALKASLTKPSGGSSKPSLQDFWDQQVAVLERSGNFSPDEIAAIVAEQASTRYPGSTNQITILGDHYVNK